MSPDWAAVMTLSIMPALASVSFWRSSGGIAGGRPAGLPLLPGTNRPWLLRLLGILRSWNKKAELYNFFVILVIAKRLNNNAWQAPSYC